MNKKPSPFFEVEEITEKVTLISNPFGIHPDVIKRMDSIKNLSHKEKLKKKGEILNRLGVNTEFKSELFNNDDCYFVEFINSSKIVFGKDFYYIKYFGDKFFRKHKMPTIDFLERRLKSSPFRKITREEAFRLIDSPILSYRIVLNNIKKSSDKFFNIKNFLINE